MSGWGTGATVIVVTLLALIAIEFAVWSSPRLQIDSTASGPTFQECTDAIAQDIRNFKIVLDSTELFVGSATKSNGELKKELEVLLGKTSQFEASVQGRISRVEAVPEDEESGIASRFASLAWIFAGWLSIPLNPSCPSLLPHDVTHN
ncbi:MAG TPA: hypothetical protein VFR55_06060 [Dehalococcoidia bacterium]|nr:hypothetical protein [Dehalococcoidia bacterium]